MENSDTRFIKLKKSICWRISFYCDFKATIRSKLYRLTCGSTFCHCHGNLFSCIFSLIVSDAAYCHFKLLVQRLIFLIFRHIVPSFFEKFRVSCYLFRQNLLCQLLHFVNWFFVFCFKGFQHCNIIVKLYFLFYHRITACYSLHFGVCKYHFVNIFWNSSRAFWGQDLIYEFRLVCYNAHHVCVKSFLCKIVIYSDLRKSITLPYATSILLSEVRWFPRYVKVMDCTDPILNVSARSKLWSTCDDKTFFSFAKAFEHLISCPICLCVACKANLFFWYSTLDKRLFYSFVHREVCFVLVDRYITEYYLHAFFCHSFSVVLFEIVNKFHHFAVRCRLSVFENTSAVKSK